MVVPVSRRLFTVSEYERMAEAGILREDDRVELIGGEIVRMAPIGGPHAGRVRLLDWNFSHSLGDAVVVDTQNPLWIDEYTEPQPDVMLLRPPIQRYATEHPRPRDVLLSVDVAEASASYDRRVKVPLYARAGIPEIWLVDLERQTITVYRDPSPQGYRLVRTVRRGEHLTPLAFPDRPLAADDILG